MRITVLIGFLAANALGQSFDFHRAAADPRVRAALRCLVDQQLGAREVGAFLIRTADGRIVCLRWPDSTSSFQTQYRGSLPDGTVAIAHTHPSSLPRPSGTDIAEAKRIGLPSYVVSSGLYVIDPSSGQVIRLIAATNGAAVPVSARCQCGKNWPSAGSR